MTVLRLIEAEADAAVGVRRDILQDLAEVNRALGRAVRRTRRTTGMDFGNAIRAVHASPDGARLLARWWFLYAAAYPDSAPLYPDKYVYAGSA